MEGFEQKEIYFLIVIGIGIMLTLSLSLVYFYYRASNKLLQEELKNQAILLGNTILTQERERKRIAKDLHDEVGAKLNIMHLFTENIKTKIKASQLLQDYVSDMSSMVDSTLETTRRISYDLLPPVLEEFGLEQAIRELVENYNRSDQLTVELKVSTINFPIASHSIELNIFRILQELISNSIKHGKASQIAIQLEANLGNLELGYQDNGGGFDQAKLLSKGLGLKNIESRVKILNGKWSYTTAVGDGFNTSIVIPIEV